MEGKIKSKADLAKKIAKVAQSEKKEYLSLKLDRAENDEAINQLIKPITKPLNIEENLKNYKQRVKVEPKSEPQLQPKLEKKKQVAFLQDVFIDHKYVSIEKHEEEEEEPSEQSYLDNAEIYKDYLIDQYPEASIPYVKAYLERAYFIDRTKMGLRHDKKNEKWQQGSSRVDFNVKDNSIEIDKKHKYSPYLMQLLLSWY